MPQTNNDREATVRIDDNGVLARWAEWQSRTKRCRVEAIGRESARPAMFVADELLADPNDREMIEELRRLGAEVIPEAPLIRPPDGIQLRDLRGTFPTRTRVRFPEAPRIRDAEEQLTRALRRHDAERGELTFASGTAASLAAIVARYADEGRGIGLDFLGNSTALPLTDPTEQGGADPFTWDAFGGRSRIADAWQLVESRRALGSVSPVVWIAVMDGGFWLDAAGVPMGQPSDFGGGVLQVNLIDEAANASGTNPNKCGDNDCPWHGNQTASAAVAVVGNGIGAAGAGGTVARPAFFRTSLSASQVKRCLNYCTAWGLDILNMSFTIETVEFFFDTSGWNDAFNFAIANGVVPIAAAGNEGSDIPDLNVRPATRTPGAITVGAHDAAGNAEGYSNHGSSVTVWAPGTVIVAPDGSTSSIVPRSGTSIAAPLVAGVAAMVRAVNPSLDALGIRQLIHDTGWAGTGRVNKGLDAYAAVFAAMGNNLADLHEPNNSRETAAALATIGTNVLGPTFAGQAGRSGRGDDDWWKFTLQQFTDVTIDVDWYQRLGPQLVELHADLPDSQVPYEMDQTFSPGHTTIKALLAPDTYRLRVAGNRPSLYELKVRTKPGVLKGDEFEVNDTFETASSMLFRARTGPFLMAREWGPGTFRATLTNKFSLLGLSTMDVDYFRFTVPAQRVFEIPTVRVFDADLPVTVELFDDTRALLQTWGPTRNLVQPGLEHEKSYFLKVSAATPTRYRIAVIIGIDDSAIPGPHQRPFDVFPPWWLDDPLRLIDPVTDYYIDIGVDRGLGEKLVFQPTRADLQIELIDREGAVAGVAERTERGGMALDLRGVEHGGYVVRVTRNIDESAVGQAKPLNLRLGPPL